MIIKTINLSILIYWKKLVTIIFLIYTCNVLNNDCFSIESKALNKFVNEILIYKTLNVDKIFIYDQEIINSIISNKEANNLMFFYDGLAYEITRPYGDSVDYYVNLHDNVYSKEKKKEVEELFVDYKDKLQAIKDTLNVCRIDKFIQVSLENYCNEYLDYGYFIKVYQHLESNNRIYVQIDVIGDEEEYEFYLVYNKKYEFQYFFVNNYRN